MEETFHSLRCDHLVPEGDETGALADVEAQGNRLGAPFPDRLDYVAHAVLVAVERHDGIDATLGECDGGRATDARTGTCNDSDLAHEVSSSNRCDEKT
jgi:hypothetical protein